MNRYELNRIRSKLRKLSLSEVFIQRYIEKLEFDNEPYKTAERKIEKWEKQDPSQFIFQGLVCGFFAAIVGGSLAVAIQ